MAEDRLGNYRAKRTKSTPEPAGDAPAPAPDGLPRFVVQEHHATRLHWDLRLEHDGVAVSWAVPNGIPEDPKNNRMAIHTEDHPLEYLEWEGDIPKGSYGAGSMRIWDRGVYETHKFDDSKVEVTFHGERLRGRYGLFPLHKRKGEPPGKDWMIHRMDPAEDPDREPMPEKVVPMLARLADLPSDPQRWAFEVKWDGVRALAYSEPGRLRLEARSGNDITKRYPELAPPQPRAELAQRDPRRRDRRVRRPGPSELRPAPAPDAHRVRGPGQAALEGVSGRLRRSSTCSGSTGTPSWACRTPTGVSSWSAWS